MSRAYYPQSFLIYQAAYNGDNQVPAAGISRTATKNEGALIHSTINLQKHVSIAKVKGSYNPETVVSKIVAKDDAPDVDKNFLNIENHKLSALVPEIRLFRVEGSRSTPFYFPVVSDYNFNGKDLDLSKTFTSNAAVIENFSITLTGKNPYEASRKFLEASLTIKVDNISVLFEVPNGDTTKFAKLADLFTIQAGARAKKVPGTSKKKSAGALEAGKSCRIAATLGYSAYQTDVLEESELRTIIKSKMLVNLYYKGHDLSLQPDGSANVTVQYTGFLEAMKGDTQFNLLGSTSTKTYIHESKASSKSSKIGDNIQDFLTKEKDEEKKVKNADPKASVEPTVEDITNAFYEIVNTLFLTKKVYTTRFTNEYFREKVMPGTEKAKKTSTTDRKGMAVALYDPSMSFSENKNPYTFLDETNVHYFNFGDLVDAYFQKVGNDLIKISKEVKKRKKKKLIHPAVEAAVLKKVAALRQELKTFAILMCDFVFKKKVKGKEGEKDYILNVADIPISIDTFYSIIFEEVTKKRLAFYDVHDFVTSMCPKILSRSFGEMPNADIIKRVNFKITTFSGREIKRKIKKGVVKVEEVPKPLGNFSKSSVKGSVEYIIFHMEPAEYTKSPGSGIRKLDAQNGIFHLRSSQDRGLVQSISFSKISQPSREAMLVVRNGDLYDELRLPHNASVTMFGNNLFMPMSQVYINPDTLGFGDPRGEDSAARRLGFGGYYSVERVTTTFSAGKLTTELSLLFNAFPESSGQGHLTSQQRTSMREVTNIIKKEVAEKARIEGWEK